ncbi:hypothetical protein MMC25_000099 [Agyrium rufum]|nr:hypothetical protein [Agyrium rufum]
MSRVVEPWLWPRLERFVKKRSTHCEDDGSNCRFDWPNGARKLQLIEVIVPDDPIDLTLADTKTSIRCKITKAAAERFHSLFKVSIPALASGFVLKLNAFEVVVTLLGPEETWMTLCIHDLSLASSAAMEVATDLKRIDRQPSLKQHFDELNNARSTKDIGHRLTRDPSDVDNEDVESENDSIEDELLAVGGAQDFLTQAPLQEERWSSSIRTQSILHPDDKGSAWDPIPVVEHGGLTQMKASSRQMSATKRPLFRHWDFLVPRDQLELLKRNTCWFPPDPGDRVPVANVPFRVLDALATAIDTRQTVNDARSEEGSGLRTPESFESSDTHAIPDHALEVDIPESQWPPTPHRLPPTKPTNNELPEPRDVYESAMIPSSSFSILASSPIGTGIPSDSEDGTQSNRDYSRNGLTPINPRDNSLARPSRSASYSSRDTRSPSTQQSPTLKRSMKMKGHAANAVFTETSRPLNPLGRQAQQSRHRPIPTFPLPSSAPESEGQTDEPALRTEEMEAPNSPIGSSTVHEPLSKTTSISSVIQVNRSPSIAQVTINFQGESNHIIRGSIPEGVSSPRRHEAARVGSSSGSSSEIYGTSNLLETKISEHRAAASPSEEEIHKDTPRSREPDHVPKQIVLTSSTHNAHSSPVVHNNSESPISRRSMPARTHSPQGSMNDRPTRPRLIISKNWKFRPVSRNSEVKPVKVQEGPDRSHMGTPKSIIQSKTQAHSVVSSSTGIDGNTIEPTSTTSPESLPVVTPTRVIDDEPSILEVRAASTELDAGKSGEIVQPSKIPKAAETLQPAEILHPTGVPHPTAIPQQKDHQHTEEVQQAKDIPHTEEIVQSEEVFPLQELVPLQETIQAVEALQPNVQEEDAYDINSIQSNIDVNPLPDNEKPMMGNVCSHEESIPQEKSLDRITPNEPSTTTLLGTGEALQQVKTESVYALFRSTYPEYDASETHFFNMCRAIRSPTSDKRIPRGIWDDFVIRHRQEWLTYRKKCDDEAFEPLPYEDFYFEAIEEVRSTRRILNPDSLSLALVQLGAETNGSVTTSTKVRYSNDRSTPHTSIEFVKTASTHSTETDPTPKRKRLRRSTESIPGSVGDGDMPVSSRKQQRRPSPDRNGDLTNLPFPRNTMPQPHGLKRPAQKPISIPSDTSEDGLESYGATSQKSSKRRMPWSENTNTFLANTSSTRPSLDRDIPPPTIPYSALPRTSISTRRTIRIPSSSTTSTIARSISNHNPPSNRTNLPKFSATTQLHSRLSTSHPSLPDVSKRPSIDLTRPSSSSTAPVDISRVEQARPSIESSLRHSSTSSRRNSPGPSRPSWYRPKRESTFRQEVINDLVNNLVTPGKANSWMQEKEYRVGADLRRNSGSSGGATARRRDSAL